MSPRPQEQPGSYIEVDVDPNVESAQDPQPLREDPPLVGEADFYVLTVCAAVDDAIERMKSYDA